MYVMEKEGSRSLCRWIMIKYLWSAVLKAWLGSDWAKPQQEHTLTTPVDNLGPESEQVFIRPPAGQLTFFSPLFILTFLHPPLTSSCLAEITHRKQHVQFELPASYSGAFRPEWHSPHSHNSNKGKIESELSYYTFSGLEVVGMKTCQQWNP